MKSILNMINKPKVNVKNILIYNNIILPVFYLYQIFFYFRNETRRLIQASKKLKKKKSSSKTSQEDEKKTRQKNNASKVYSHIDEDELRCCWHKKKENTLNSEKISWYNSQWKDRLRRPCHTLQRRQKISCKILVSVLESESRLRFNINQWRFNEKIETTISINEKLLV